MREIKRKVFGYLGIKFRGMAFNIDLINGGCPVSCPSCAVGSLGRRKGGRMSLELFKKILDKAQREVKIRNVQLYAYSDPTMHPDLHLFVRECRDRGIDSIVSTVLQRPQCDFKKVIEERPREFRISFPGLSKLSYYQGGGKASEFMSNFLKVVELPRYKETLWTMAFHVYNDNQKDLEMAEVMAKFWGLKFVPLNSIFMCNDRYVSKEYSEKDLELISHLVESPEKAMSSMKHSDFCFCFKQVTIDALGMTDLCQNTYDYHLKPFLDTPLKELVKMQKENEFCKKCRKIGGNSYQENYTYFFEKGNPVDKVQERYK
jgi:hypothetical protein